MKLKPRDIKRYNKIADKGGIWLLEDNAQAPAALAEGDRFTATVGQAGVFSFNRHKN